MEVPKNSGGQSMEIASNKTMGSFLMKTGLIYDPRMTLHKHEWDTEEQECPERISYAFKRCQEMGLVERCRRLQATPASEAVLTTFHSSSYVDLMRRTSTFSMDQLWDVSAVYDGVFFNKHTYESALLSLGSVLHMTENVLKGALTNGITITRPPGHHAMTGEACGYCFFNNVALAAQRALESGVERVLIVDWDVHHGQGTQYAFYDDPRVLYVSIHRYEDASFWPNLRESNFDFIGAGAGQGFNLNIPLNKVGMTDSDYLAIFHNLILPIAHEYDPQLVLVSCGFDAAIGCPEGNMWVHPAAYGHFVHKLKTLASGKLVVVLEGGYCVETVGEGIVHSLKALLGDPCPRLKLTGPPCDSIKETILDCIKAMRPYWKSLGVQGISKWQTRPDISHLKTHTWDPNPVIWPFPSPTHPPKMQQYLTSVLPTLKAKDFPPTFKTALGLTPEHLEELTSQGDPETLACLQRCRYASPEYGNEESNSVNNNLPRVITEIMTGRTENGLAVVRDLQLRGVYEAIDFIESEKVLTTRRVMFVDFSSQGKQQAGPNTNSDVETLWITANSGDTVQSGWRGNVYQLNLDLTKNNIQPADLLALFNHLIIPIGYEFDPDLVLFSVGRGVFAEMDLVSWLSVAVHNLSCLAGGRLCVALNDMMKKGALMETLRTLTRGHIETTHLAHVPSKRSFDVIRNALDDHKMHWRFLRFKEDIPMWMDS